MAQEVASALERHLITSIVISAALALLIVAAIGLIWWRGKRWVRQREGDRWSGIRMNGFTRGRNDPEPRSGGPNAPEESGDPAAAGSGGARGAEPRTAALIREAAARAGALRDEWDRSYREARRGRAAEGADTPAEPASVLEELLREQRETNALLRELVARLGPRVE